MNVLLCTPYEEGKAIVFGGITIWARNIVSYYNALNVNDRKVSLCIQPFDRRTFVSKDLSRFQRYYFGAKEYLKMIKETKKSLIRGHFDIVHVSSSASISLVKDIILIRLIHKYQSKAIIHLHFGRAPEIVRKRNWEYFLLKRVLRTADMVLFMDTNSINSIKELGFRNIKYVPNPISEVTMDNINKKRLSVPRVEKTVLFVGHIIRSKGVFELAEAARELDGISLSFVGKCPEDTKSDLLRVNSKINFIGEVTHERVIEQMLSSDLFVLPSYTEGFPNVILESMACECAIVGTSVGAIPEMLNINSTAPCGLVVPPRDSLSLRNALETLLNDSQLRDTYRKNAKYRVNDCYRVGKIWAQLESIWESTLR